MKLGQYIDELVQIRNAHGEDAEVIDSSDEPVGLPELHEDEDGTRWVVVCDRA